jgi:hypothetical protein
LQQQKRDVDGLCDRRRQQRKRDYDGRTQQLAATVIGRVEKTLLRTKGKKTPEQQEQREEKREKQHRKRDKKGREEI